MGTLQQVCSGSDEPGLRDATRGGQQLCPVRRAALLLAEERLRHVLHCCANLPQAQLGNAAPAGW